MPWTRTSTRFSTTRLRTTTPLTMRPWMTTPRRTADKGVRTDEDRPGAFGRLGRFVREVVAELRKVIWPTRKELLTYAAVVIVFVSIMLTIVGLLDLGFARAILFVLGGSKK
jgi:preprotein translocase SecE subunit